MKYRLLSIFALLLPIFTFAQQATEKGLDERVNDAFMPIAVWWEGLILTSIPIGQYNVPIVLILLVLIKISIFM